MLVPDVLGTAGPADDDDGGSDPNSDCGRFAIRSLLKPLKICTAISASCLFRVCFLDLFVRSTKKHSLDFGLVRTTLYGGVCLGVRFSFEPPFYRVKKKNIIIIIII